MRLPLTSLLCALSLAACATPAPSTTDTTSEATSSAPAEPALEIARAHSGRISSVAAARANGSVIRTQEDYDAFVEALPKTKIQKKNPSDPNDDPILERPAIDFSTQMLVVAACSTFYCSVEITGLEREGAALLVRVSSPGEPEDARMYGARPIGMNGEDTYGNYAAAVVPRHDEVTFGE